MIKRRCKKCKKIFHTYPCRTLGKSGHVANFCSKKCYAFIRDKQIIKHGKKNRYKKGNVSFSKLHPEIMQRGSNHHFWKGDSAGYRALHYWLRRIKGIPKKCEWCGREKTTSKSIHWANVVNKHKRNPDNYIALCCSCHKLYDLKRKS